MIDECCCIILLLVMHGKTNLKKDDHHEFLLTSTLTNCIKVDDQCTKPIIRPQKNDVCSIGMVQVAIIILSKCICSLFMDYRAASNPMQQ